jgi:hypothetical protein
LLKGKKNMFNSCDTTSTRERFQTQTVERVSECEQQKHEQQSKGERVRRKEVYSELNRKKVVVIVGSIRDML